jgi:hypothetical protein
MTSTTDENRALKPRDLPVVLALARAIDSRNKKSGVTLAADKLYQDGHGAVLYPFQAIDSASTAFTTFKYFFDISAPEPTAEKLHDVFISPPGISAMLIEMGFLMTYSVLAQHYKNKKSKDDFQKFIAYSWDYFRDLLKGLKNAYRAWETTFRVLGRLGRLDLSHLLLPIGLLFGVLSATQRILMRLVKQQRRDMIAMNKELLERLNISRGLTKLEGLKFGAEIKQLSDETRALSFLGAVFGGFIDGLYLYMGVICLAAVAFPLFVAMAVINLVYTLACVVNRVFEEYEEQLNLSISQTKCKLAIITREMEGLYCLIKEINEFGDVVDYPDLALLIQSKMRLRSLIGDFDKTRTKLQGMMRRKALSAALLGMKHGLYAYSALASVAFLLAGLLSIAGVAFPPILMIFFVCSGLALLFSFMINSLVVHSAEAKKHKKPEDRPYAELLQLQKSLSVERETKLLEAGHFSRALEDGLSLSSSPQFLIQEWSEVVRSVFAGARKGKNFAEFAGCALQEQNALGHYQDTPGLFGLIGVTGLLFSSVMGMRGFASQLSTKKPAPSTFTIEVDTALDPIYTGGSSGGGGAPGGARGGQVTDSGDSSDSPSIYRSPANPTFYAFRRSQSEKYGRLNDLPETNIIRGLD